MVGEGYNSKVYVFFMLLETYIGSKGGFITRASGAIGKRYRDMGYIMKSKRKSINSLLGHKVAHGSTIYEYADRGMVHGASEDHGFFGKGFREAANFESCFLRVGVLLVHGPGFLGEGWGYRA